MNHNCVRCLITGLVQGVWFRGSTRTKARGLGLQGYARNLPDGSVEVLACGDPPALIALQHWLHQGPPFARVDNVTCSEAINSTDLTDFQVY